MSFKSIEIKTKIYEGQKPGTSGLRKAVKVFQQEHYTENFIQSILSALGTKLEGSTLVVGGDGRYYGKEAVEIIIKIAAANKVAKLVVGQNGILSTPAVSCIIRKYKVTGGIVLTASHNPGGPDNDFGIKFNTENGGPAPDGITNKIYKLTTQIEKYSIVPDLKCPIDVIGLNTFNVDGRKFTVEIIDSVNDYVNLMKDIFDFRVLKSLFDNSHAYLKNFSVLIDSMHGVTGPYVNRIFLEELKAPPQSVINTTPLPDFGGHHPDPNLTYAADLVKSLSKGDIDFGAAFDGDGDRNMILGKNAIFVTPSDSLAILANNLNCIPYFQKNGVKGFARSMPTAASIDRVADELNKECFEVPTGWKYFGNLMDAGRLSICGEESFGTGSDHIREKDGIWAVLSWLSVIANTGHTVEQALFFHWSKYGQNYFSRYDYENCNSSSCDEMIKQLEESVNNGSLVGKIYEKEGKKYTVKSADNFQYTDPIDGSLAVKQGIRILFEDGSRLVYRLSGTGSSGATVRVYFESYEPPTGSVNQKSEDALKPLIQIGLELAKVREFTGRDSPTVIT